MIRHYVKQQSCRQSGILAGGDGEVFEFSPPSVPLRGKRFFRILWGEELAADTEGRGAGSIVCKTIVHLGGGFHFRGRRHFKAFYGVVGSTQGEGFPDRGWSLLARHFGGHLYILPGAPGTLIWVVPKGVASYVLVKPKRCLSHPPGADSAGI